jgi:hypothetical protein
MTSIDQGLCFLANPLHPNHARLTRDIFLLHSNATEASGSLTTEFREGTVSNVCHNAKKTSNYNHSLMKCQFGRFRILGIYSRARMILIRFVDGLPLIYVCWALSGDLIRSGKRHGDANQHGGRNKKA